MENSKPTPITVDPTGGEILSVVGDNYRGFASGKQTNCAFSAIEMLVPPGNGPGPHSHADFYEYIIDGEVEVHSVAPIPLKKAPLSWCPREASFIILRM